MNIFVFEQNKDSLSLVMRRLRRAVSQAGLKRIRFNSGGVSELSNLRLNSEAQDCVIIGPSHSADFEIAVEKVKNVVPKVPLAAIFPNDLYALDGVRARKELGLRILALADIGNIAQFLLDTSEKGVQSLASEEKSIIGVCQVKGGVGASTLAASLAATWIKSGESVCLVDLDVFCPQLSRWSKMPMDKRDMMAEFLKLGEVPAYRLPEVLHHFDSASGKFSLVGQPRLYSDGFHQISDVISGAPSSEGFMSSLFSALSEMYDLVVVDFGRFWGVSHFATMALCQDVVLVLDEQRVSVTNTIDSIRRMSRESDKQEEFDFSKWSLVLNGYTGTALSSSEVKGELLDSGLFSESKDIHIIPFCEKSRSWTETQQTFYDVCQKPARSSIEYLANSLVPLFGVENVSRGKLPSSGALSPLSKSLQKSKQFFS